MYHSWIPRGLPRGSSFFLKIFGSFINLIQVLLLYETTYADDPGNPHSSSENDQFDCRLHRDQSPVFMQKDECRKEVRFSIKQSVFSFNLKKLTELDDLIHREYWPI